MDDAHRIVVREILKLGTRTNLVLYLNGLPSVEKEPTQVHRENLRKKAVERADKCMHELEDDDPGSTTPEPGRKDDDVDMSNSQGYNTNFRSSHLSQSRSEVEGCVLVHVQAQKTDGGLVGGSIGRKREEVNMVVIGIGLDKFSTKTRLSSLHESFQSHFVQKARSLDYIVVRVNEYYFEEVPDVREVCRRLYCSTCGTFMRRDIMVEYNICNVVRSHLLHQQWPLYLQPVDKEGHYPWMQDARLHTEARAVAAAVAQWGKGKDKDELKDASEQPRPFRSHSVTYLSKNWPVLSSRSRKHKLHSPSL
ncbi:hypothetical protein BC939DRAFT_476140 [Gamsiella multidivaricata]|uniref:uncharacterized protein n=1 Tax=Gamsiella multidivaricata TaxID=101098 RepID=UPI002220659C|nr:uncharacterized protein BC939DRAFT_476140 [Gamsiella multidivaricata]KAI7825704.1 hypothetical protein BC939DRAFT_476140 [Gamsiella multidivaricata]